jgi:hypothetical protein
MNMQQHGAYSDRPLAAKIAERLSTICAHSACSWLCLPSAAASSMRSGTSAICPETSSKLPQSSCPRRAYSCDWEYGPMLAGAQKLTDSTCMWRQLLFET